MTGMIVVSGIFVIDDTHKQCKQLGASKLCKKILESYPDGPVSMEAKQALKLQKTKGKSCAVM